MFTQKIVMYLVRKKLGLSKYQHFRFTNQKTDALYVFGDSQVMKICNGKMDPSGVSLNWLLDDNCVIEKVELQDVNKSCQ